MRLPLHGDFLDSFVKFSVRTIIDDPDAAEVGGGVSGDKKVCAGPTPVPLSMLHAELSPLDSLQFINLLCISENLIN